MTRFGELSLFGFEDSKDLHDVVVVHGLYGSRHRSWTDVEWQGEFLSSLQNRSARSRLSLYTYDVFGILTRGKPGDEATKLLDSLLELRDSGSKNIPITFIAHDLGGLLVKEAVVQAQQQKYEDIYTSIRLMVLLGCPNQGVKFDIQIGCANLLMSCWGNTYSAAEDFSGPLVDWVQAINNSFAETRMSAVVIIYTGISTHPDPEERVFDTFTASMLSKAGQFTTDLGHKDLFKHPFLRSLGRKIARVGYDSNAALRPYLNFFTSQTAPQYPIDTIPLIRGRHGRSAAREAFLEFINSSGAGCWVVHTPGYPGCSAVEAAEQVLKWTDCLTDQSNLVTPYGYFSFDAQDGYRDSVEAALSSILSELCSRCFNPEEIEVAHRTLDLLSPFSRTQVEDLYAAYIGLVLERLQLRRNRSSAGLGPAFTIILGNLDGRIRHGAWLYKSLKDIVNDSDLRLKVIITSSDPVSLAPQVASTGAVAPSASGLTNIHYYELGGEMAEPEDGTGARTSSGSMAAESDEDRNAARRTSELGLIQSRPEFCDYMPALRLISESCGEDYLLWELVVIWLKEVQIPGEDQMRNFISQLIPATPNKVFEFIFASTPLHSRPWWITLIERVLFAFRPITLSELLDIQVCDSTNEFHYKIPGASTLRSATETLCSGILTIRRGEIHLAHPMLRDFLIASTEKVVGGWFSLDSAASIHGRIATTCLNYLISLKTTQLMEHRAGPGSWHTSFERKDTFLSYAVKYWLRHATNANKAIFESNPCTRFLEDTDAVRLWTILYQGLSPPVVNRRMPSANFLESLAIFAEHEAEDLLISSVKRHRNLETPGLNLACLGALVAAASRGNVRMVKELLVFPLPAGETFDQPMMAAIESGNNDVFLEIIYHGQRIPGGIRDLGLLLARAASLGHSNFADGLLNLIRASGADISSPHSKSPLTYACQRGHVEILELLILKGGPSIVRELEVENNTPLPIRLAVQFGQAEILNILTSTVAKRPEDFAAIRYYRLIFTESSVIGRRRPICDVLNFINHNLQSETSLLAVNEISPSRKLNQEERIINYLNHKVIGRDDLGDSEDLIVRAIQRWPHAVDLIGLLIRGSESVTRGLQFPIEFEIWMQAAVASCNVAVVKQVFEIGAKSPYVTPEILERLATIGLEGSLPTQSTPCMKYLIENGANITDHLPLSHETPLFHAAYNGLAEAVKVLIEAKVDVNAKGNDKWYPIHACYDDVGITRQLVNAGANINKLARSLERPDDGEIWPPLAFSVAWDCPDVVDEQLKARPSPESLRSGLKVAVTLGLGPMRLLLDGRYQLDLNVKDGQNKTALHCISAETSVEVVELLIANKADIELVDDRGYTPLAIAAHIPNTPVVQCLVDRGARINQVDGPNEALFIWACHRSTLDMVKIMHTSKDGPAEVNRLNPRSRIGTPLNAALLRRQQTADREGIIWYLLEEGGADINIQSMLWSGALQIACLTSTVEMVRTLIEQYQANVNVADHAGRTPLHMALYRTCEHVELLLRHGARLDAVDITKRNALHFAVLSGRLDVVKLVLDKNPTFVNEKDAHGWTPLLWALRAAGRWGAEVSEMKAIVQQLLDCGARRPVRARGMDRTWYPRQIAKYYEVDSSVAELLLLTSRDRENMSSDEREWDWRSGYTKRGVINEDEGVWCDHCLLGFCGFAYTCMKKGCGVTYCLHCYQSWDKLHDPEHKEPHRWGKEIDEDAGMDENEETDEDEEMDEEMDEVDEDEEMGEAE
ncbi:hypothetical protein O1611_g7010 [Lasiodiplodia mahajangana]|uniref:Uncharacterized protein n=1 Tax=Lasiodiplodia mahajangana TaxID=1108764 RepID=A0ACC2JHA8_9PEZI|nr:hypothetical protein O1611_g7010 [Lasiodiplodia mahajangana]